MMFNLTLMLDVIIVEFGNVVYEDIFFDRRVRLPNFGSICSAFTGSRGRHFGNEPR